MQPRPVVLKPWAVQADHLAVSPVAEMLVQLGRWFLNPPYIVWEELAVLLCVAVLVSLPGLGRNASARLERRLARSMRRPWQTILLTGFGLIAVRLLLLPLFPPPVPIVPDELSMLMGAKTFASGRLTNPTHPLWPHFETDYILHEPSYMTIYPPAQPLLLALGQVLGHPWIGALAEIGRAHV